MSQVSPAFKESEVMVAGGSPSKALWVRLLRESGVTVHVFPEEEGEGKDLSKVHFAYIGKNFAHVAEKLPNLKGIQCMSAGMNHIIERVDICRQYRVFRIVEASRTQRMACWNLWAVLNCQRRCEEYRQAQAEGKWDKTIEFGKLKDNAEFHVGMMGLGSLGLPTAEMIAKVGFNVSTWTRTAKDLGHGIRCYHGQDQFEEFLGQVDALVCLLALTPDTKGVLNAKAFSIMPKGSYVINAGRGKLIVTDDLLAALQSGHLAGAVLDVTDPEPLPSEHPLFYSPKVRIFPHMATCPSEGDVKEGVLQTLETREMLLSGKPVPPDRELDWEAGY